MRFLRQGIVWGPHFGTSFITLALTRSRCARDLNTIYENTTVSPGLSFIIRGNGTPLFVLVLAHTFFIIESTNFTHISCPILAIRKYASVFFRNCQYKSIYIFHMSPLWLMFCHTHFILPPNLLFLLNLRFDSDCLCNNLYKSPRRSIGANHYFTIGKFLYYLP